MKHCVCTVVTLLLLVSLAAAQDAPHYGIPIDWSSRHVISSAADNVDLQQAIRRDPRQVYNWMQHNRTRLQQLTSARLHGTPTKSSPKKGTTTVDWSFPLGAGTVPQHAYPAKWSFDTTSAYASCTDDYVVYGLNVTGSSGQPNLVRINNLYAGTGGACGANPSLASAYNVTTVAGGIIQTSPAVSYDGTQVAFIESGTSASVFHVLTWGTTGNNGTFTGNLYSAVTPGGGSPANNASMTSLSYSASTTTYSSPYIDYLGDRAFFGDDNGHVYVTTCVFRCAGAPAIAAGWPVQVAAGVKISPPVWDSTSNKIFVGGSDGKLYSLNLATCPTVCVPASITVGTNNANGGIFDGVLFDSTFETLFAFTGDDGSGKGAMVQTDVNFSFTIKFNFGASPFPIYAGILDDAYYQNNIGGATVSGNVFSCGALGGSNQPDLYWVTMAKGIGNLSLANPPKMNGANSKVNVPGNPGIGCNPMTEFKNGTTDRLFLSQSSLPNNKCVNGQAANGCAMMYDITTPASTVGGSPNAAAIESAGTSGMVVDNVLTSTQQGSSIYFSNLGTTQCTTGVATPSYCAVKLTQSLFQ